MTDFRNLVAAVTVSFSLGVALTRAGEPQLLKLRSPAIAAYDDYKRPKGAVDRDGFKEVPIGYEFDFVGTIQIQGVTYYSVDAYQVRGIADINSRAETEKPDLAKLQQWKLTENRLEEFEMSPDRKNAKFKRVVMVFLDEEGETVELDDGQKFELVATGKVVDVPAFKFSGCDEYRITQENQGAATIRQEFWHPDVGLVKSTTKKIETDGQEKHLLTRELCYYFHGEKGQLGYLSGKIRKLESENEIGRIPAARHRDDDRLWRKLPEGELQLKSLEITLTENGTLIIDRERFTIDELDKALRVFGGQVADVKLRAPVSIKRQIKDGKWKPTEETRDTQFAMLVNLLARHRLSEISFQWEEHGAQAEIDSSAEE